MHDVFHDQTKLIKSKSRLRYLIKDSIFVFFAQVDFPGFRVNHEAFFVRLKRGFSEEEGAFLRREGLWKVNGQRERGWGSVAGVSIID